MAFTKVTPSSLQTLVVLALILSHARTDPDPLQDYCVADMRNQHPYSFNGAPCIDPDSVCISHFTTSALSKPGNAKANHFGFNVTLTNIANLPGLNTMGLTMARIDIAGDGLVPLHSHPRASEVTICLKGVIGVGFVDTSNRLFTQILRPGESFVFPKGLIHYLYNSDPKNSALAISGLSSQNPGAQIASIAAFMSKPEIPDEVLGKAFQITGQDIAKIRKNLGG
ncbi:hypothetical protein BT93_L5538 [Corymbia citriodora subsp. variegata]|uniref:Germin-like protein n=1 Tax=Corymbia citriodora subsp. variegata TaxID=360336 RepID=A0A8T0CWK7_CORYI|nr:hypothetical protein BT93_L5538 [Corymbia citriodora subsp. variegata]